jgi:hypothetical protein
MGTNFFRRRLAFRKLVNAPAWIEKEGNSLLERCKLVNVSDKGARLDDQRCA